MVRISTEIQTFQDHKDRIRCLTAVFDGNGERETIWSGSGEGMVVVYDAQKCEMTNTFRLPAPFAPTVSPGRNASYHVSSILFVQNGRRVWISSSAGVVYVFDAASFSLVFQFPAHSGEICNMCSCTFGTRSDSSSRVEAEEHVWIASADSSISVWNAATHEHLHTLQGHVNWVRCLVYVPGNGSEPHSVWSGGDDTNIRIWNGKTGLCTQSFSGHSGGILCSLLVPAPESEYLGGTSLWVPTAHKSKKDGPPALVWTGSCDRTIRCWDIRNAQLVMELSGHSGWVTALNVVGRNVASDLLSPGRFVVSGSSDRSVRIWTTETGQCISSFNAQAAWVTSLTDGPLVGDAERRQIDEKSWRRLWTAGSDGIIHVWEVTPLLAPPDSQLVGTAADTWRPSAASSGKIGLSSTKTGDIHAEARQPRPSLMGSFVGGAPTGGPLVSMGQQDDWEWTPTSRSNNFSKETPGVPHMKNDGGMAWNLSPGVTEGKVETPQVQIPKRRKGKIYWDFEVQRFVNPDQPNTPVHPSAWPTAIPNSEVTPQNGATRSKTYWSTELQRFVEEEESEKIDEPNESFVGEAVASHKTLEQKTVEIDQNVSINSTHANLKEENTPVVTGKLGDRVAQMLSAYDSPAAQPPATSQLEQAVDAGASLGQLESQILADAVRVVEKEDENKTPQAVRQSIASENSVSSPLFDHVVSQQEQSRLPTTPRKIIQERQAQELSEFQQIVEEQAEEIQQLRSNLLLEQAKMKEIVAEKEKYESGGQFAERELAKERSRAETAEREVTLLRETEKARWDSLANATATAISTEETREKLAEEERIDRAKKEAEFAVEQRLREEYAQKMETQKATYIEQEVAGTVKELNSAKEIIAHEEKKRQYLIEEFDNQSQRLEAALSELQQQLTENSMKQAKISQLESDLSEAQKSVHDTNEEAHHWRDLHLDAERGVSELQKALSTLRSDLGTAENMVQHFDEEKAELQGSIQRLEKQNLGLKSQLEEEIGMKVDAENRVSKLQGELKATKTRLGREVSAREDLTKLVEARASLKAGHDSAVGSRHLSPTSSAEVKSVAARLQSELRKAKDTLTPRGTGLPKRAWMADKFDEEFNQYLSPSRGVGIGASRSAVPDGLAGSPISTAEALARRFDIELSDMRRRLSSQARALTALDKNRLSMESALVRNKKRYDVPVYDRNDRLNESRKSDSGSESTAEALARSTRALSAAAEESSRVSDTLMSAGRGRGSGSAQSVLTSEHKYDGLTTEDEAEWQRVLTEMQGQRGSNQSFDL